MSPSTALRVSGLLLMALAMAPAPAYAQIAEAIGQPLPRGDLPAGTVTVRVVAGEMSSPVTGTDVRLTVNGDTRAARTDASGRATFPDLTPGATVQAAIDGEAGEIKSAEFPVPEDSGVAVLLSTVEWKGDPEGGGGPMAGGRPEPRTMAGQPRPEQGDPAGRITVRVTYNDLASFDGIIDRPVVMVKYGADGVVAQKVVRTDTQGRAVFDDLDTTGGSAYYAMSLLPRDGKSDRTMTLPLTPHSEVGLRVMLSGEKLTSSEPVVDDLSRFAREPELPAGTVLVIFGGDAPDTGTVELHSTDGGKRVAKASVRPGRPIPSTVQATVGEAKPSKNVAAAAVAVHVVVAAAGQELGLPEAAVRIQTAAATAAGPAGAGKTDQDGKLTVTGLPVGVPLQAVVDIQGKTFTGASFTLAADQGAEVEVKSSFELLSLGEAGFADVAATPEGAYYAELDVKGKKYRSPPFQMAPERGVVVPIFVIEPRIQFAFQLDAFVDDDYLATRGSFILQNASFAPWAGPSEGLRIPAPAGSTGLVVADESKEFVAVDSGSFRLLRPVPPMGADFRAGFSVPIHGGDLTWDLPLPMGATQSSLAIRMTPGMTVDAPKSKGKAVKDPQSGFTWYAIQNVDIAANQRMLFHISGLPTRPVWQHWARLVSGLAVILLLALGVVFAAAQRPAAPLPGSEAKKQRRRRIEDLLDQVAALDRAGEPVPARRDALVEELEKLYIADDRG